jgi:adenine-specific DNA-methyltransferase
MDKQQLQKILQKKYNRNEWNSILEDIFPSVNLLKEPEKIEVANKNVKSFHQTGLVRLNDGKNLAVFEVVLDEGINLLRNRVVLRNLTTRYIDQANNHGVLVVYDQGKENYRFTFVTQESGFNEKGEWATFETASKRFTYVLGEGESCRTASERLAYLASKKNSAKIDDVIDAFSVERLSKEFFAKYKEHYQAFVDYLVASNFYKSAFDGEEKTIRDFVKKTLGRIVFLYFLQKKGWLGASDENYSDGDNNFMQTFWETSGKNETFYSLHLCRLFFNGLNAINRANDTFEMPNGKLVKVPYLNGGLFDKDKSEPDLLTFPPKLFEGLFSFFSEYNFTIDENDPEEHEVGIDPEMLGHIFENLLEDNKDKGAFYTPKEIVQYMTQESLIEYLKTGLEKKQILSDDEYNALKYFVRYKLKGDEIPKEDLKNDIARFYQNQLRFIQTFGSQLNTLLDNVKICDPAIGSGAFPMGLLNEIYRSKVILNNTYTPTERADVKRHIIENSIYGVDVEKGAVDIARLRFWLSLIVDEEKPTPLPNLDYKIVVGDSLVSRFEDEVIDIDWNVQHNTGGLFEQDLFEVKSKLLVEISKKQNKYFEPSQTNKEKLKLDIRNLKLDLLINQLQLMIEQSGIKYHDTGKKKTPKQLEVELLVEGWKRTLNKLKGLKEKPEKPFNHFDWKLDFPELLNPLIKGKEIGFDIVIANPPYLKERDNAHIFAPVNNSSLGKLWHQGKMDYWFYFLHKAMDISKGSICFITSRYWLNSQGAKKLINRVRNTLSFVNVVDIGKLKVFDNVAGHHMIGHYTIKKSKYFEYKQLSNSISDILKNYKTSNLTISKLSNEIVFRDNDEIILTKDIYSNLSKSSILGELFDVSQGVVEASDRISKKQYNSINRHDVEIGQGVFVLTESEIESLALNSKEKQILKPYLDPNNVIKYRIARSQKKQLIYSDKNVKEQINSDKNFTNIKKHLDYFGDFITSSNAPYGIHRAREPKYFENPKIIFKNMFESPEFTYDDKCFYFGFSFSSIINMKNDYSLKYLLALLNSSFAKKWFYDNGKLRGAGVDIGVEKLRLFPVPKNVYQSSFIIAVEYLLLLNSLNSGINEYVPNSHIIETFEEVIDAMVMELFFKEDFEREGIEFIKYSERDFKSIEGLAESEQIKVIHEAYQKLREKENEIRNNLKLMDTRLNEIVMPIKSMI